MGSQNRCETAAVGSGREIYFPSRRDISHWWGKVFEPSDDWAPSPTVGRGVRFNELPGRVRWGVGHPRREKEEKGERAGGEGEMKEGEKSS